MFFSHPFFPTLNSLVSILVRCHLLLRPPTEIPRSRLCFAAAIAIGKSIKFIVRNFSKFSFLGGTFNGILFSPKWQLVRHLLLKPPSEEKEAARERTELPFSNGWNHIEGKGVD